jgi:cold shock CspA family protein
VKHFGIVQSFDEATGYGSIRPENGGRNLGFERSAMSWDRMVSPRAGARLSYHLRVTNGKVSAVDLHLSPACLGSMRKSFSVFRSAAEEVETKARQESSENERRNMSATAGRVVRTPMNELPFKVILERPGAESTEHAFATMRECEAFVRRNTPVPPRISTLLDRDAGET